MALGFVRVMVLGLWGYGVMGLGLGLELGLGLGGFSLSAPGGSRRVYINEKSVIVKQGWALGVEKWLVPAYV